MAQIITSSENAPSDTDATTVWKAVSWNIFRNYHPGLISASLARIVADHQPELILLQEVPFSAERRFVDSPLLREYHAFYAPAHTIKIRSRRLNFESSGQVILSRGPLSETAAHELPILRSRSGARAERLGIVRRNAVYARIDMAGGATCGVYNVHLENRAFPGGRRKQAKAVLDVIARRADSIVIVGGDFNTFLPRRYEAALGLFEGAGFDILLKGTGARLLPQLDYIMVRGALAARRQPLRARGSDHQPVLAELVLPSAVHEDQSKG